MTLPKRVIDAAKEYNAWMAKYKPTRHEVSADSIALCKDLDERLVWTFHNDDANGQMVTKGFWNDDDAISFFVSEIPWRGSSADIYYLVEIIDSCDVCGGAGGNCNECYGEGFKTYWVD